MRGERFAKARFAAWVGIVGNLALAVVKAIIGVVANSKALLADAIHSASDIVGSFAVLIGLRASQVPPDPEHPYGHGKAEPISAIIVSIILFVVGFEMAYNTVQSFFAPIIAPGMLAVYVALISMGVKEWMFRYKYRIGKELNSQAIIANAWEHRSDVYSSFAALIGIGGAILGQRLGYPALVYLDPVAGVFVSGLVIQMAYRMLRESIHSTLDVVWDEEKSKELRETAAMVPGVLRVDELLAREHGHYVIVDVKISVDAQSTVEEGHRIGKQVKRVLLDTFANVQNVFVHINPYGRARENDTYYPPLHETDITEREGPILH
ncbi:cation diffusion facilitator family transporter [Aneurinibacillus sp. UBA3580]|jgi:cation diffusion facilitator family transporter|uniref:cation diffusion facilitator family transporter n=1 Tax=Aneurinibacillus sp. UBA3580 TaxID=1946041 RepID=UPI0025808CEF|nr:cation diffusion facilitator family transporter [Aneurinibacillus sp. UBA3580]